MGQWPYLIVNSDHLISIGRLLICCHSLPGQRMSACTCKGEDHAGPDVSYGRGVPEIDVLEALVDPTVRRGVVSQSAQMAPVSFQITF